MSCSAGHRRVEGLRPSWFMQNFTGDHPVAGGVRAGELVTATGDGRLGFVDAADIAAVAVRALTDPVAHDTDHVLTGPEALSYADAAAVVTRHTGRAPSSISAVVNSPPAWARNTADPLRVTAIRPPVAEKPGPPRVPAATNPSSPGPGTLRGHPPPAVPLRRPPSGAAGGEHAAEPRDGLCGGPGIGVHRELAGVLRLGPGPAHRAEADAVDVARAGGGPARVEQPRPAEGGVRGPVGEPGRRAALALVRQEHVRGRRDRREAEQDELRGPGRRRCPAVHEHPAQGGAERQGDQLDGVGAGVLPLGQPGHREARGEHGGAQDLEPPHGPRIGDVGGRADGPGPRRSRQVPPAFCATVDMGRP
jgi:hypothetical protein